jgi:hypothetical protein
MMIHAPIAFAGLLQLRHERLKLYLSGDGPAAGWLDIDLLRRLLRGVTVDVGQTDPAAGFALLAAQPGGGWRWAGHIWRADRLARLVLCIDPAAGQFGRAPGAAFCVGSLADVALIAAEWRKWRLAAAHGDAQDRYLADVDR